MKIFARTLMLFPRHPGDVADFEEYRRCLPEQWCPLVTLIGFVRSRHDGSPVQNILRHFTLETSVYDVSKAIPVEFSVACFLENTRRWQKVKLPPSGSFLSVTAKLVGRTAESNLLALRILDLAYLPRTSTTAASATSTTPPPSKRPNRWDGRAASSPAKRQRTIGPALDATDSSPTAAQETVSTPSLIAMDGTDPPVANATVESPSLHASPSTTAEPDASSLSSIPSLTSESGNRPHRSRQPPRKYVNSS